MSKMDRAMAGRRQQILRSNSITGETAASFGGAYDGQCHKEKRVSRSGACDIQHAEANSIQVRTIGSPIPVAC
jgi:hypothetical protein